MDATGECAGVEPLWNVGSVDKLAARNIQYLGAAPTDLRSVVVYVLTAEGADLVSRWFSSSPAQVAACWQEGVRVLAGISDLTIVDGAGPTEATLSPEVMWRYQTVSSATFNFQATQAFGIIRHGEYGCLAQSRWSDRRQHRGRHL